MKKRNTIIYAMILSFTFATTNTKNIIFDLGGVVYTTNKSKALQFLGIKPIATYILWHWKNPKHLQSILYTIMNRIMPWPAQYNTKKKPTDPDGTVLPYSMYCWLTGKKTTAQIKSLLIPAIDIHRDWFANTTEQILIKNLVAMIFTPAFFVETQQLNEAVVSFIKTCKKEGHKVYILSNWDKESFILLQKKYPALFSLFDGITISGNTDYAKPDPEIYHTCLKTHQLQAKDCLFIDDQRINVETAKACGIPACVYNDSIHEPDIAPLLLQV